LFGKIQQYYLLTHVVHIPYARYVNTFREKVANVIEKIKGNKKLSLLAILLLVAAVPLTVFIAQQTQDIRQQANTNQATITVTPNTIAAGGNVAVNWTIAQPTNAPTAVPTTIPTVVPPTPTNTPIPTAVPTATPVPPTPTTNPCPMYRRATSVSGNTQTVTLTPVAPNSIRQLQFTQITNANVSVQYADSNMTAPFTYTHPENANSTSVTFTIQKITSGQAATVRLNVIDNCGPKADFYGLGASQGLLPSFEVVKKAYAQTALTGGETIQLFKIESNNTYTAIGAKRYLNCTAIPTGGVGTNPVPPSSPIYTGSCNRIQIPLDAQAGSYVIRMFATDGTTVIGVSNILSVTPPSNNDALKSGLISYWSMDTDTGNQFIDAMGRNSAQTLMNTNVDGKIGKAHIFGRTAGEYVELPNTASFGPEKVTISAWVFPTDANSFGAANYASIFNRRNTQNTGGMNLELEGDSGFANGEMHCDVWVKLANGSIVTTRARSNPGTKMSAAAWNHVACSYDGSTVKLYINGSLAASATNPGVMNNAANSITRIGSNIITGQMFKGTIDEVGYWNRGLSDAEITQLATGISLYPPTAPTVTPTVTGSLTPTITPTPTSTATTGHNFSTTLYLTGIGSPSGTFAPKHPQRNAVITLFDTNNNLVATRTGQISYATASRSFIGTINAGQSAIPAGNYLVKIQTPQFLRKQYPGILSIQSPATIVLPNLTITTGDVNGDNKINILDYNILVGCFGAKANSPACTATPSQGELANLSWKVLADLNDDEVVDGIDYNLFIRSLATKEGD